MRTVPMPEWVKKLLDEWLSAAGITSGRLFRRVNKAGRTWGDSITEKVVWHVVRKFARETGIHNLAPHDLRRTCARLCHSAGGELEQIQFLLGHVFDPNDGTISRLQAANPLGSERSHRHRAKDRVRLDRSWKCCRPPARSRALHHFRGSYVFSLPSGMRPGAARHCRGSIPMQ